MNRCGRAQVFYNMARMKQSEGPYELEEFIEYLNNIDNYCKCDTKHIDFCICKYGDFDDEE